MDKVSSRSFILVPSSGVDGGEASMLSLVAFATPPPQKHNKIRLLLRWWSASICNIL